ncbi:DUF5018 domain-containing protein [Ichthyobacterium seriolicida]|uniref:Pkd domain containing protein n=1 Tax=Ichthyobacterium seriolicida TaxID=242600 RepID=A0A1J1E292_9FLAO|nr:hypothetical protein [Ichthyobacterium seriolicida]BAV94156.1 pkd domain containing protein [Ichthyobacterium seriolicida]
MKTFSFVKSIIFSFVLLSVFIFSCEKNKGYDNNLAIGVGIESISLIESENPEKGLVSDITCDIDTADYTVSLTVPHSAILTGLKFDIKLSEGYSISPASGDEVNFELEESSEESSETPSPKRYKKVFTVTAKDGTAKEYKVYITKGSSNECAISSFKFINDEKNNGKGLVKDITGIIIKSESGEATISLIVPNIADLADLKPTIEISSGATVSPANEEAKTFTSGSEEEYTVTAQDGRTKTYKVTVTKEEGPKLESFKIPADNSKGIRDEVTATFEHEQGSATGKILLNIPYTGTAINLTGLTPTIEVPTGCSLDPTASEISDDISGKTFTLTKTDTGSKRVYTVQAVKGPSIKSFKFQTNTNSGNGISTEISATSINHDTGAIAITIPSTVNLNQNLTPTIEVESGVTVDPLSETPRTFTGNTPVQYKVSANGIEKTYEVTVTKEAAPRLTKFEIAADNGKGIKEKVEAILTHTDSENTGTILLKFPRNTNTDISLTGLTPTIEVPTGCAVSPASGAAVTEDINSATFTLTKTDTGSQRVYTVEAVKGPYISKFEFKTNANSGNGISTDISATSVNHDTGTIVITVPSAVILSNSLTPTITLGDDSIATVEPAASAKVFNQAVQYIVKNSTYTSFAKTYTVTVTKEAAPKLESFKIPATTEKGIKEEVEATLTHAEDSDVGIILLKFPHKDADRNTDIDLTGLTPAITLPDGCTVSPASGAAASGDISATGSNTFTLTKSDTGSKRVYTITAVKGPYIKSFKFETKSDGTNTGINTEVIGQINHENNTITITVPASVKKNSDKVTLTPTIVLGGDDATIASSSSASGVSQEFTSGEAVQYIVTGKEGMQKTYQVTVTREKSTIAQIKTFTIGSDSGNITHPNSSINGRIVVPVSSLPTESKIPTTTQSDYATVTPADAQTFSYENSVTYTVTAEDNSTAKTYDVYIHDSTKVIVADSLKVKKSDSTEIIPDSKNIDATTRVITITVPSGTSQEDLKSLTLSLDSSSSSSYTLEPTGEQDFSNEKEVKYTLKESSGSAVGHYWVKVAVAG